MADLEVVVRYKSVPAKFALFTTVFLLPLWGMATPIGIVLALIGLLWALAAVADGGTYYGGSGSALESVFRIFGALIGLILLLALGIFSVLAFADDKIKLTKSGITLPWYVVPIFGFKRRFSWGQIRSMSFSRDAKLASDKGVIELRVGKVSTISLSVGCFQPEALEQFLLAVDLWCPQCPKNSQLIELKESLQVASSPEQAPSYTAMWDEELGRRFSSTAFMPLEPDVLLQEGKLKVLRQLSFGGLSAIYLCQKDGRQLVVLKEAVIPESCKEEVREKAIELFKREAQLLVKLDHPNIVKVLDHFVEGGRNYLLLEYLNGQDLRQFIKQNGAQSEKDVLLWAAQMAAILQHLHSQDPPIIHRDLTPDNLILASEDSITLIDFGAANEFIGTATGTLVGKQSFIAPEQFRGKAVVQSDLYALGCTLHFLLTGEDPEPLSQSRPRQIKSDVSSKTDELVALLTTMEVEDRIQSASEAYERIQQIIGAGSDPGSGSDLDPDSDSDSSSKVSLGEKARSVT